MVAPQASAARRGAAAANDLTGLGFTDVSYVDGGALRRRDCHGQGLGHSFLTSGRHWQIDRLRPVGASALGIHCLQAKGEFCGEANEILECCRSLDCQKRWSSLEYARLHSHALEGHLRYLTKTADCRHNSVGEVEDLPCYRKHRPRYTPCRFPKRDRFRHQGRILSTGRLDVIRISHRNRAALFQMFCGFLVAPL